MTEHSTLIHRGISILHPEVPGALVTWTHDETDAHGAAPDVWTARQQINRHLGVDPGCRTCLGTGAEDWAHLAVTPCPECCDCRGGE